MNDRQKEFKSFNRSENKFHKKYYDNKELNWKENVKEVLENKRSNGIQTENEITNKRKLERRTKDLVVEENDLKKIELNNSSLDEKDLFIEENNIDKILLQKV
jgi:hypothetical protein